MQQGLQVILVASLCLAAGSRMLNSVWQASLSKDMACRRYFRLADILRYFFHNDS